jgi:hypothetical protein
MPLGLEHRDLCGTTKSLAEPPRERRSRRAAAHDAHGQPIRADSGGTEEEEDKHTL